MLSLTGKKIESNGHGNQSYIKWARNDMAKIPKTAIVFIFLRFIVNIIPFFVIIVWKSLKIINFIV